MGAGLRLLAAAVGDGRGSICQDIGGTWFPLGHSGFLYDLAQLLPSYWLVQASHVALGGAPWPAKGRIVIAAWTVILTRAAQRVYRRDPRRV